MMSISSRGMSLGAARRKSSIRLPVRFRELSSTESEHGLSQRKTHMRMYPRAWCLSLTVDTTVYFSGCRREMPASKLSARLPSYTAHALPPEVDRGMQGGFPHALCHQRRRNQPTTGVDPQQDRLKARINSRAAALVSAILPRQRPWESDSLSVLFPDTTKIAAGTVPHP